jgi:hypothetical protein
MFNQWTLKTVTAGTVLWDVCSLFGTGNVDAEERQNLSAVEQETAQHYPGLAVLSHSEMMPNIKVESIESVRF